MPPLTPFQTAGPYFHLGLSDGLPDRAGVEPPATTIRGRLLDGAGRGIAEGALEFWTPERRTIVRVFTDADGGYRMAAARPLARRDGDGTVHAPHFTVRVLGRGILTEYLTRVYFADAAENDADPVLRLVPADRRSTLIAAALPTGEYHFDVVVQGPRETVFFDV